MFLKSIVVKDIMLIFTLRNKTNTNQYLQTMSNTKSQHGAGDFLESQDFFDLMSSYRICDPLNQDNVVKRFEAVKEFIRNKSAVPEMLEALKAFNEYVSAPHPKNKALKIIAVEKMEQAIAKAEGN